VCLTRNLNLPSQTLRTFKQPLNAYTTECLLSTVCINIAC